MTSDAFERFRQSFLDDPFEAARDGLDVPALLELEGEERARAEALLFQQLPETRAVIGLGELRSRRALPQLVKIFEAEKGSSSWKLIAAARALWQIEPDPRWLAAELEALEWAASPERRQAAAEALRDFHDPAAVPPLVKALDAPEDLVRHHAARALLAIHGQPDGPKDPKNPIYRVMSPDVAKHEAAKQEILAAIAGRPIAPVGGARPPGGARG